MTREIPFRSATEADVYDLAYLHSLAAGGIVEFLFSDVVPEVGPVELFAEILAQDKEPYSWRNCVVADDKGKVVGKLLSYAADDEAEYVGDPRIPADRYSILAPGQQLEAPGTWHICALAVSPGHRGQGLGRRLLQLGSLQAREKAFTEMSLHVFEDNDAAIALYESLGFRVADRRPLDHPALAHHDGDMLLMRCAVS